MSEVERLCSSVLMMNKGNIIDYGKPKELIQKTWKKKYGRSFFKTYKRKI